MDQVSSVDNPPARMCRFCEFLLVNVITASLLTNVTVCKTLGEAKIAKKIGGAVEFGASQFGQSLRIALFVLTFCIMLIVYAVLRYKFHRDKLWRAFSGIKFSTPAARLPSAEAPPVQHEQPTGAPSGGELSEDQSESEHSSSPPSSPLQSAPQPPVITAQQQKAAGNRRAAGELIQKFQNELNLDFRLERAVEDKHCRRVLISHALRDIEKLGQDDGDEEIAASTEASAVLELLNGVTSSYIPDDKLEAASSAAFDFLRKKDSRDDSRTQLSEQDVMKNISLKLRLKRAFGKIKSDLQFRIEKEYFKGPDMAAALALYDAMFRPATQESLDILFTVKDPLTEQLPEYYEKIIRSLEAFINDLKWHEVIKSGMIVDIDNAIAMARDAITVNRFSDAIRLYPGKTEASIAVYRMCFMLSRKMELFTTEYMQKEYGKIETATLPSSLNGALVMVGRSLEFNAFDVCDPQEFFMKFPFDDIASFVDSIGDENQRFRTKNVFCLQFVHAHLLAIRETLKSISA
ncbi:MAG: hypothetical protein LBB38_02820, partial [Puniceicoccales bacterium]|nr:hypothetical protein [Puniceicoccales bacterium]